jgi:hypothetical protein
MCRTLYTGIGPSGVRALPLAAGINEGGHYFRYFGPSALLLTTAIQNHRRGYCRVSKMLHGLLTKINKNSGKKNCPPAPPTPRTMTLASDWLMTYKQASSLAAGS